MSVQVDLTQTPSVHDPPPPYEAKLPSNYFAISHSTDKHQ